MCLIFIENCFFIVAMDHKFKYISFSTLQISEQQWQL